jgi:tricorn protease
MGAEGIAEFIKWYYPQIRKEGLIVDERSNGGGNVSQWILARLGAKLLGTRFGNASELPRTYPYTVFYGHLACLINETSASDGDIFPYYFKKYGLGPLIGERTWGGVRGIRGYWPLSDGGYVTIPEDSLYGLDSQWVLENHGVDPDMEVDNLPGDEMAGRDAQLETAIKFVMDKINANPMTLPPPPPLQPPYPPNGR